MTVFASLMKKTIVFMGFAAILSGCSGVSEKLGLGRKSPDEFTVVTKAPLVVPPNFTLRPPRPGERALGEVSARERARRAVIASSRRGASSQKARDILVGGGKDKPGSKGEQTLLAKTGATKSDPKIREVLRRENLEIAGDKTLLQRIIFWKEPADKSTVVDARKESRRLQTNSALGRPPNEGDVPYLQRKDRGILSLFK